MIGMAIFISNIVLLLSTGVFALFEIASDQ